MLTLALGIIAFFLVIAWERKYCEVSISLKNHAFLVFKHVVSVLTVVFIIILGGHYLNFEKNLIVILVILLGSVSWLYFDFYFSRKKIWKFED